MAEDTNDVQSNQNEGKRLPWDHPMEMEKARKKLGILSYHHPYFTYHVHPVKEIWEKVPPSEKHPYSMILKTYYDHKDPNQDILPEEFTERTIQEAFGTHLRMIADGEVIPFLNFQYQSYLEKSFPNGDPTAFLDYMISTVRKYYMGRYYDNIYRVYDHYQKLKVIKEWVKSQTGFIEPFGDRLRDWDEIYPMEFAQIAAREQKKEQAIKVARNSVPEAKPVPPPAPDNFSGIEESKTTAIKRLEFLSGHQAVGRKIMSEDDYKRMVGYTLKMIEIEGLPEIPKPITKVDISKAHIQRTYYLIHKDLYGIRPKRKHFIDFLYAVFPNHFKGDAQHWTTTYTKFSHGPTSYEADVINFGKIGKK